MFFSDILQASVIYTFGNGGAHQIVSLQLEKFARKTILLSSLVNFQVLKHDKEQCTLEEAHDKANEKKCIFTSISFLKIHQIGRFGEFTCLATHITIFKTVFSIPIILFRHDSFLHL